MQPCLNDPTETEYRSFYLQWEFTSMTSIRFNSDALSHHNNTISACHYWTWKLNHQINILFLFSPSWCLSPSVLVWHILPYCPLEHFKSSYLLSQIWPMFFPSSFLSFVIHLLQNLTFCRWSHFKHPSLILTSLGTKERLTSLNFLLQSYPGSSSYGFTWWTNFSNSLNLTTLPLSLTQYSSLWPIFPTSSPKAFPPLPTLEVA